MISQVSRQCTVELQALPSRIGQVRRIVSAQLRYWNLDCLIEKAALGVTELLTNVHQHAGPDKVCTVEMELLLGRLTVSVHDRDPRLPSANSSDPLSTSGRGLALIEAFSESWGARPDGESGKVVWFTLPAPAPTTPPVPPLPVYGAATTGPFTATVPFGDPALATRAGDGAGALAVVAAHADPSGSAPVGSGPSVPVPPGSDSPVPVPVGPGPTVPVPPGSDSSVPVPPGSGQPGAVAPGPDQPVLVPPGSREPIPPLPTGRPDRPGRPVRPAATPAPLPVTPVAPAAPVTPVPSASPLTPTAPRLP